MANDDRVWCSSCYSFRPAGDFGSKKNGKPRKTCSKHQKQVKNKRSLPTDQWASFIDRIQSWNKPDQNAELDLKCVFNLDELPVSFNSLRERNTQQIADREPLNEMMRKVVEIIWRAGGYRFRHRRTAKDSGLVYEYHCSQDSSKEPRSLATGKRDVQRMERFPCQSKLRLRPSLEDRTLTLVMHHLPHRSYVDVHLSSAVLEYINQRVHVQTAAEIYHSLKNSKDLNGEKVNEYQVYYRWRQANASKRTHETVPLESAICLLEYAGSNDVNNTDVFYVDDLRTAEDAMDTGKI